MENQIQEKCKQCPKAQEEKKRLLREADSVFDAVSDYEKFLSLCQKHCKNWEEQK